MLLSVLKVLSQTKKKSTSFGPPSIVELKGSEKKALDLLAFMQHKRYIRQSVGSRNRVPKGTVHCTLADVETQSSKLSENVLKKIDNTGLD